MNDDRRLAVTLQNLSSRVKDQAILADAPKIAASLDDAKTAAAIAQLEAAQRKIAASKSRRRR